MNQPAGTVITNQLRDVEQIQYLAPADVGRLRAEDFRATVDLAGAARRRDRRSPCRVERHRRSDPRVTILAIRPPTVPVVLDQMVTKQVR